MKDFLVKEQSAAAKLSQKQATSQPAENGHKWVTWAALGTMGVVMVGALLGR